MSRVSNDKRRNIKDLKRDFKKGERIERLTYYTGVKRGRSSERIVKEALNLLVSEGKIKGFFQFKPYTAHDRRGIDFKVKTNQGETIFFQVKSSYFGAERFIRKGEGKIPVIIVEGGESPESVKKKIIEMINE